MGCSINQLLNLTEDMLPFIKGRTGWVFPGQGSQSVGMISHWVDHDIVRETFSLASLTLGYDLLALVQKGPLEKLNQTEVTQPAILTTSVALWRLLQEHYPNGMQMSVLAGHSLGEYTAMVCAEALSLQDAVFAVSERGRLMQSVTPEGEGAMAAILGLNDAVIEAICLEISKKGETVSVANYNSPGQAVVAGHTPAVMKALDMAKAKGAKRAIQLAVSVPSHCVLMQPAADKFAMVLQTLHFSTPKIPILHNVDVAEHTNTEDIRQALIKQLVNPLRWTETIEKMAALGVETLVECGPGAVLTGLNKRIVPALRCCTVSEFKEVLSA